MNHPTRTIISTSIVILVMVSLAIADVGDNLFEYLDTPGSEQPRLFSNYSSDGFSVAQGPDILVNNDTIGNTNFQGEPAIARTSSGEFVVVWTDDRSTVRCVYAQRFEVNGTPLGDFIKVTEFGGREPAVAIDNLGRFIVVWVDYREDSGGDIFAQLYDDANNPIGIDFKVNDDTGESTHSRPDVAMNASGESVITWEHLWHSDVYVQRIAPDGSPLGSNIRANDVTVNCQNWPVVAIDSDGGFTVVWADERHGYPDCEVYAQRFDSDGLAVGSSFVVNYDTTGSIQWDPDVCYDGAGNSYVVWRDYGPNGGLYARRYDPSGVPMDSSFMVTDPGVSSGSGNAPPSVAASDLGSFVITWNAGHPHGVVAQMYYPDGFPRDTNFTVNIGFGSWDYPMAACDAVGNFAISYVQVSIYNDVYMRLYDSDGNALADDNVPVADDAGCSKQKYPAIAASNTGEFVISWEDQRDVFGVMTYFQRLDAKGLHLGLNTEAGRVVYRGLSDVAIDPVGNTIVVWPEWRSLYARWYSPTGVPLDTAVVVNDIEVSTNYQWWCPSVDVSTSGTYVISWKDIRNGHYADDIYAQQYSSANYPIGINFKVNDVNVPYGSGYSRIAMDASGSFIAAWGASGFNTFARRFGALGTPLDSAFLLNELLLSGLSLSRPSIVMQDGGSFIIVWTEFDLVDGDTDIFLQRYDEYGVPLMLKAMVCDDLEANYQGRPAVAGSGDNGFLVAWEDTRNGNGDIYGRRYSFDGKPTDDVEFLINAPDYASYDQHWPVAAASGNTVMVSWYDNRREKGWDIFAQVVALFPDTTTRVVHLNIEPGSCPNLLELEYRGDGNPIANENYAKASSNVLSVAVLGTSDFNVHLVDVKTIRLEGAAALGHDFEDVGTPVGEATDECECNEFGPDGVTDLVLRFSRRQIVHILENNGVYGLRVPLVLDGVLINGPPISGTDCVVIPKETPSSFKSDSPMPTVYALHQNYPNAFNPITTIEFSLEIATDYTITIYNVTGRVVKEFTGRGRAGMNAEIWNATDRASGVYFYRLEAGDFTETRKMVLMK